jgi:hypothetical protein
MLTLNPNVFAATENGRDCFIEDVPDADGRLYRIEYRCRPDGRGALAFCLHNPWPAAAIRITDSHLMSDGSICTSANAHQGGDALEFTVRRARFWCTGYSFLREHGVAETRRQLGREW